MRLGWTLVRDHTQQKFIYYNHWPASPRTWDESEHKRYKVTQGCSPLSPTTTEQAW